MEKDTVLPEPYYIGHWTQLNEHTWVKRRLKTKVKTKEES